MIYFTADLHFCHANIIKLSSRPFDSLEHMHQQLIANWNNMVKPQDEVYILGDFMYKGRVEDAERILSQLNGIKYLVKGNHDKFVDDEAFNQQLFAWVKDYYVLKQATMDFVLFHYPILEWNGYFRNAIHLYGHVHNSINDPQQAERLAILGNRAVNVGVDVNDYRPVSIDEILRKVTG